MLINTFYYPYKSASYRKILFYIEKKHRKYLEIRKKAVPLQP